MAGSAKKRTGLSEREQLFVREYLVDFNGTKAALRAGFSQKGARTQASRLLTRANIQSALAKAIERRAKRVDVSADRVLTELARIAFADTTAAVRVENGHVCVTDTADLTDDQRAAIAEISESTNKHGGSLKVRLHDKVRALELLCRHLGLDRQQDDEPGTDGQVIVQFVGPDKSQGQ